jgi:hypothetical protein
MMSQGRILLRQESNRDGSKQNSKIDESHQVPGI